MKTYRTIGFEPLIWLRIQEICQEFLCEPEQFLSFLINSYWADIQCNSELENQQEKKDDVSEI